MSKPDAPAPPNYAAAAEQTAEGNLDLLNAQTVANRPDQITPWGTSKWTNNNGQWTQNIELSPEQQEALSSQLGLTAQRSDLAGGMFARVGEEFGDSMDWAQFGDYQKNLGTGDEARNDAIDAMYGQATSRLDRRLGNQKESVEAQLRNQGLRPGDEAYDRAMTNFTEGETDAYNQAMFSAIRHGGMEGSRVFGMNKDSAAFGNTVRQAQISEEMQKRGFSLNEINAILSGQQIAMPNMPGFNAAGNTQGPDYLGAAQMQNNANWDAYNADSAGWNSFLNGIGNIGSMAMQF